LWKKYYSETCSEIPREENVALDVADGDVVRTVLVESLLTEKEEERHL
jgi:hypothetical protein